MHVGPERDSQSNHLGQSTGDQRGSCIQTQFQAIHHAGRNGHDVFERPSQLSPDKIRSGIYAESCGHEHHLQVSREGGILTGQQNGRGFVSTHFSGKAGPREDGNPISPVGRQQFVEHLGHQLMRIFFNPF